MHKLLQTLQKHFRRGIAAYMVLLTALVPTCIVYLRVRRNVEANQQIRFADRSLSIADALQDGLDRYSARVRSVAGLFEASDDVRPREWERFIASAGIQQRHPAARSVGYAPLVRRDELPNFPASMVKLVGSNLVVSTKGTNSVLFPTVYLEQFNGQSDRRIGWDAMQDPRRAHALQEMLASHGPSLSGPHVFDTDTERLPAFILFYPIFSDSTNGAGRSIQGVVFSSFVPQWLLRSLTKNQMDPALQAELFAGPGLKSPIATSVNHGPALPHYGSTSVVHLLGKEFALRVTATPEFALQAETQLPALTLGGGILFSFLLFAIAWTLVTARNDAEQLSNRLMASQDRIREVNRELEGKVAEHKATEHLLAKEKELLAVTLRSIAEGVITTDIEGRIVLFNRVAEYLTGCSHTQAVGAAVKEVYRTRTEEGRESDVVRRAISTGKALSQDRGSTLVTQNGARLPIAQSVAPIVDQDGRTVGAVLVFRDITEKLKTEVELLRASKLESIGVLAGGIAHDFNNILTVILGNISLAGMLDDNLPKPLANVLAEAEKASLRARDLTHRLLTFAKGGSPIKRRVAPGALLRDCAHAAFQGGTIQSKLFIAEDLWPVDADEGQLAQVFQNLLHYARHSVSELPNIDVYASNQEIAHDPLLFLKAGRYVRISIRDHGAGLAPEQLNNIFDPYFSAKKQGNGLELATAYSIVRKHEGQIRVESVPGEGTVFHIYLPAAQPEAERLHEPRKPGLKRPAHGRVLVMDDESSIRQLATLLLRKAGYAPDVASDGAEAISKYDAARKSGQPFAAVIMDLTVPNGMGGVEAIRQLRSLDPEVKAIVSSGYSNDPVMANYRDYGFHGVVPKPYSADDLSAALADLLHADESGEPNVPVAAPVTISANSYP